MKNFVLMMLTLMLASCTGSVQHPEFENNVKLGQKFFQLHGEENFEAMVDMLSDDLQWTSPKYGEGIINKETQLGYIKICLLYTSPSPRDGLLSRMPSSA